MTEPVELISLLLTLQPAATDVPRTLPLWWGRAAHQLLLDLVERINPELAGQLHQQSQLRPFTVSNLMGHFTLNGFTAGGSYTLRFTAFSAALSTCFEQMLAAGMLLPGQTLMLDYLPFTISSITTDATTNPWAGKTNYASLAAPWLSAAQMPARRVALRFGSPTGFKSHDLAMPLPLPELVFGSLLNKWNAYAPITFSDEVRRFARECLAVSRFELSSRSIPVKDLGLRFGAVGMVSYHAVNPDRYWLSIINTLAAFSCFGGVGAATSYGMGQTRLDDSTWSTLEAV